jgi:hypothetical protein
MARSRFIIFLLVTIPILPWAHTGDTASITWTRDVARIVYRNCISCHHPGGPAASLMKYQEARLSAEAIKHAVLARSMPPWNAVDGFGEFKNSRGLSQEDIEIVAQWVEAGSPEGNPIYLPPEPDIHSRQSENYPHRSRWTVSGKRSIKHPTEAIGIRAEKIPSGGTLQVIAERPDGSIEPVIWIQKFNQNCDDTYYFLNPMLLPSGTRIQVIPETGKVSLIVKRAGQE